MDTIFHSTTNSTTTTLSTSNSSYVITYTSPLLNIYTPSLHLLYKLPIDNITSIYIENNKLYCLAVDNTKEEIIIIDVEKVRIEDKIVDEHIKRNDNTQYKIIKIKDNIFYTSNNLTVINLKTKEKKIIIKNKNIKIYFINNQLLYTANNDIYILDNNYKSIFLLTVSNVEDIKYNGYLILHTKDSILFYKHPFEEKDHMILEKKIMGEYTFIEPLDKYIYAYDGRMNLFYNYKIITKADTHYTPLVSLFSINGILYSISEDSMIVVYNHKYNKYKTDKEEKGSDKNNTTINNIIFKKIYYQNNNIRVYGDIYCAEENNSLNFYSSSGEYLLKIIIKDKIVDYTFNDEYLIYVCSTGTYISKLIITRDEDLCMKSINLNVIEYSIDIILKGSILYYLTLEKNTVIYDINSMKKIEEYYSENINVLRMPMDIWAKGIKDMCINNYIIGIEEYLEGYILLLCAKRYNIYKEYSIVYSSNIGYSISFTSKSVFNRMVIIEDNIYLYDSSSIYCIKREDMSIIDNKIDKGIRLKKFYVGELIHSVCALNNKLLVSYDKNYNSKRIDSKKYGEKVKR